MAYPGDHLPLIGIYSLPVSERSHPLRAPPPFDICLSDRSRREAFKAALEAEVLPTLDPDELLAHLRERSVLAARQAFFRRSRVKGWSPLCDVLTLNLLMVVNLQVVNLQR